MFGEGIGRLAVDVVVQDDIADRARIAGGEIVKGSDRVADQIWRVVGVVLCVEVGGDDVVAEVGHVGFAGAVECQVGGPHVGGEEAEDVAECDFGFVHFVASGGRGKGGEIGVVPGVGGDLVAFVVRAFDDVRPLGYFVDVAVAVVADNEEGGFYVVLG